MIETKRQQGKVVAWQISPTEGLRTGGVQWDSGAVGQQSLVENKNVDSCAILLSCLNISCSVLIWICVNFHPIHPSAVSISRALDGCTIMAAIKNIGSHHLIRHI